MPTDFRSAATGRISPRYPSYVEQQEALHRRREAIVARSFLALTVISLPVWYYASGSSALIVAGIGLAGFFATCFYAGSRQTDRMNRA